MCSEFFLGKLNFAIIAANFGFAIQPGLGFPGFFQLKPQPRLLDNVGVQHSNKLRDCGFSEANSPPQS